MFEIPFIYNGTSSENTPDHVLTGSCNDIIIESQTDGSAKSPALYNGDCIRPLPAYRPSIKHLMFNSKVFRLFITAKGVKAVRPVAVSVYGLFPVAGITVPV